MAAGADKNSAVSSGASDAKSGDSVEAVASLDFEGLPDSVSMGVDIVEVERIRAILGRSPAFARRAFSQAEQDYCNATASPESHYATRFAAKEAVVKALGCGFRGIGLRDVEVAVNAKGKPRVVLHGGAARVACELGVEEIPLSLSYTHSEAVACALVLTADAKKAAVERTDPAAELTRQFKEARAWL